MRAKESFHGRFDTELSFKEGDLITVLMDTEDMWSRSTWWCGELRGKRGLFATTHVESFNEENVRREREERKREGGLQWKLKGGDLRYGNVR